MISIPFTVDAYLALLVVLVNFVFAILVLIRTSRTTLYIIFLFVCISNMLWNMGDFLFYFSGDRFWFYLSLIGSGMLPALMFHFINTLVMREQKNIHWILTAYLFSAFLALSAPLSLSHVGIKQFVDSFYWNILYLVLLGPFIFTGIAILFRILQKAPSKQEKSRLRYIFIATLIAVVTGLTDLVQLLKIPVPPLGHLGCLVYSSILAIGVFKHRQAYDVFVQMQMKLDALSEMAAGIAHEICNPLSSIKGASNLLANELKNIKDPKIQEYHAIITEEIERLNHILINFQDLSRPLKLEKEPININKVLEKTVKLAEMGTLKMEIRLELDKNLPMVQADASSLKQVFLNLIKNAAEACSSGGELLIKTESDLPWVKISFSDNGPGIPPEFINRIFEPFFTTKAGGMGVGLAICQRIIQAHDGRIEVNNRLPKGTQFNIFLPGTS
jgi:signal transduction histidine kinase